MISQVLILILILAISFLLILGQYSKYQTLDKDDLISFYSIEFLYNFNTVLAFLSILSMHYKKKYIVPSMIENNETIFKMKQKGMNVNFSTLMLLALIYIAVNVINLFGLWYFNFIMDYDIIALLYPFAIRTSIIAYVTGLTIVILTQYVYLKKYLRYSLKNTQCTTAQAVLILENVTEFYHYFTNLSVSVANIYGLAFFLNICGSTIEIVFCAIQVYIGGIQGASFSACLVLYSSGYVLMGVFYTVVELIEIKVNILLIVLDFCCYLHYLLGERFSLDPRPFKYYISRQ